MYRKNRSSSKRCFYSTIDFLLVNLTGIRNIQSVSVISASAAATVSINPDGIMAVIDISLSRSRRHLRMSKKQGSKMDRHNFIRTIPRLIRQLAHACLILFMAISLSGCNLPQPGGQNPNLQQNQTLSTDNPPSPANSNSTPSPLATEVAGSPEWLWVINEEDMTIVRINTQTNRTEGMLKPGGILLAITDGPAGVFAAGLPESGPVNIIKINPLTFQVEATLPLNYRDLRGLAVGGDAVWAAGIPAETGSGSGDQDAGAGGEVTRIDPASLQVAAHLPITGSPNQITLQDDALWVLEDSGITTGFLRIDPSTSEILPLPFSRPDMTYIYRLNRFTRSNTQFWGLSIVKIARSVYGINPADGRLDKIIETGANPEDYPLDITSDGENVWAALHSGKVIEIDAGSGEILDEISINCTPDRIFNAAGSIWVQSQVNGELIRINPTTGKVLVRIITGSKLQPTPSPTPRLAPGEVCQGSYPTHLVLNGRALVSLDPPLPNRVRTEPNLSARILGEMQPGSGMTIIEGPVCTDGWVWWKVKADGSHLEGWTAEGDGDTYWLTPE